MNAIARHLNQAHNMNKTEARYAEYLSGLVLSGEIESYSFEMIKLRLAMSTFYTPDFMVVKLPERHIELHEVKGFWRDDARVKIKVAAATYPIFVFRAVQWDKREGWKVESF